MKQAKKASNEEGCMGQKPRNNHEGHMKRPQTPFEGRPKQES
jgi:hypothetical protein